VADLVTEANRMLDRIEQYHLSQWWVAPVEPLGPEFSIGPFHIGRLNAEQLRDRCERAKSDFFSRYEQVLRGRWTFARDHRPISLYPAALGLPGSGRNSAAIRGHLRLSGQSTLRIGMPSASPGQCASRCSAASRGGMGDGSRQTRRLSD
jgi:hypothetical protein